jgi:ligand-binding sensor domain-containing protein
MTRYIIIFFFFIIYSSEIFAQPDSRFRPFDWTIFKGAGSINSISEGYTYIYLATQNGGLKRFNVFGNKFDEPITRAQGLKNNSINATHFDHQTGLLWIATKNYLQYSFSREGDWYNIRLDELGFMNRDKVEKIGSSSNYLWLKSRSTFYKLDHSSGILIGIYPNPDEINIKWSSGYFVNNQINHDILLNYSIMDGYLFNGDELTDNIGRRIKIKTFYFGNHGNIYFGTSNGILFHATNTMKVFSKYIPDINNIEISSLANGDDNLWIGSSDYISSKGIVNFNLQNYESDFYEFESTINMTPTSIYSMSFSNDELWVGGDDLILYFNTKKNFWRTLTEESIGYLSQVYDIYSDSTHIWVASSSGITCIDRKSKKKINFGFESLFNDIPIYVLEGIDNEIWMGTYSGLYILFSDNPQIIKPSEIGKKYFSEPIKNITAINTFNDIIYIAGDMGIFSFDRENKMWDYSFPSNLYEDKKITAIAVSSRYIFLGSNNGLFRIDKKTGFIRDYKFTFIGEINDLFIDNNILWIGSNEGLIKFKWKRDT